MAELASFTALGGVVGDTFGAFEIQTGGVLANGNYVWKETTPSTPPAYNAAWIANQSVKANYAAALLPVQSAMVTSSKASTLAAGQTGVKYFDLSGSATLPNGIYLERGGSYLPGNLPPALSAISNILIPFNTTLPTGGVFNFDATKTGAAPFQDFSDGTPTIQSISATPTVTGPSPRIATLRLPASEVGTLTSLDLYSNQITAIPSQIGSLTALTNLALYSNQITATEIIAFAQLVAANSAWDNCSIDLSSNPGSAAAAVDAGFITAKATLEGRGCTVTI